MLSSLDWNFCQYLYWQKRPLASSLIIFPPLVFANCSILKVWLNVQLVWNKSMNTVVKHLLDNYSWALNSIEIKGCIGMKWMSSPNILAFISLYNSGFFCLVFQAWKYVFIQAIIHFVVTCIVKNRCWLCLFSKYPKQNFLLLEMLSKYSFCFNGNALNLRGVFRTLSNRIEVFANTYSGINDL